MCALVKVVANNGALLRWLLCVPRKSNIHTIYVHTHLCVCNSVRHGTKQFSHFHIQSLRYTYVYVLDGKLHARDACEHSTHTHHIHLRWIKK